MTAKKKLRERDATVKTIRLCRELLFLLGATTRDLFVSRLEVANDRPCMPAAGTAAVSRQQERNNRHVDRFDRANDIFLALAIGAIVVYIPSRAGHTTTE